MAMIDHAPERIEEEDYQSHLAHYRGFIRLLWWNVAAIASVLIGLALWAG